jgi:hypothetical protein
MILTALDTTDFPQDRQCIHPPKHLAKQTPVQMPQICKGYKVRSCLNLQFRINRHAFRCFSESGNRIKAWQATLSRLVDDDG